MENLKEKVKHYGKKAGQILIIALALFIGYISSEIHTNYKSKLVPAQVPVVKTMSETSIALNERNEMMIINRADGTYEIYQDSVGITIFNMYAAKMYFAKTNPTPTPEKKTSTNIKE